MKLKGQTPGALLEGYTNWVGIRAPTAIYPLNGRGAVVGHKAERSPNSLSLTSQMWFCGSPLPHSIFSGPYLAV